MAKKKTPLLPDALVDSQLLNGQELVFNGTTRRWVPTTRDTGLRTLAVGANADAATSTVHISRTGNLVVLAVSRLTVTVAGSPNNGLLSIPVGFRPATTLTTHLFSGAGAARSTFLQSSGGFQVYGTVVNDQLRNASPFVFYTTDDWPTVLP